MIYGCEKGVDVEARQTCGFKVQFVIARLRYNCNFKQTSAINIIVTNTFIPFKHLGKTLNELFWSNNIIYLRFPREDISHLVVYYWEDPEKWFSNLQNIEPIPEPYIIALNPKKSFNTTLYRLVSLNILYLI